MYQPRRSHVLTGASNGKGLVERRIGIGGERKRGQFLVRTWPRRRHLHARRSYRGRPPEGDLVPTGFDVPTSLVTACARPEPLGPQHNLADHAAWTSSIEHIRTTPGFEQRWPPPEGMSLEDNLADLQGHADDFAARCFTFTVLETGSDEVIGCVYDLPSRP